MSRRHTPITDQLATYIRDVTLREPEALRRLRDSTENHPRASWQIAPEQGQFLHFLARIIGARQILEVGVFMGYSSSWLALALPEGGKLVACDHSEEYAAIARKTWREAGVEERIDLRVGPALETLDTLIAAGQAGTFDFAFVDADKGGYVEYYERALVLLRRGGVFAADNVLSEGAVVDAGSNDPDAAAIRAFNEKLRTDQRVILTMATMGDGFTLASKV
ncbi:MAG TPA: class I SAM-dependent methyltransferase [Bryobacteraceae bacterium]|nr:class I SAM-dependent methyltransferase [Bryobacteraceae bacterium]